MDVTILNPSITSGVFAAMLEMSAGTDVITAISGHPIGGSGGISTEGYWRPSVDDAGIISWLWSISPTSTVPSTANIMGPSGADGEDAPIPEFRINSSNAHWEWKYTSASDWIDLNIVASGAVGPQGTSGAKGDTGNDATPLTATTATIAGGTQVTISYTSGGDPLAQFNVLSGESGQNGKDGKDGTNGTSVYLDDVSLVAGGTQITIGWGTSDTSAFVIPSGAAGTNGISPTVSITDAPTAEHPQGGKTVTITDADHPTGQSFDIWNGTDGQGATTNLLEGTGIQITHTAGTTNYTIAVSADYALKSELPDLTPYATKTYADETSANALSEAESWVNQQNFATSAGLAANTRYELTTAGWTSAIKIQVDTTAPTADDGILHIILDV